MSVLVNPQVGAVIYAADLGSYYNLFKGISGSGDIITQFYKGVAINSAATLTLGSDGNYWQVNGTTTITAISAAPAGTCIALQFAGALTLTHGASLRLSGAGNYTTAANDVFVFISDGGGSWREVCRTLAAGIATAGTMVGTIATAAQPNVTSVGTLTSITTSGRLQTARGANVNSANNLTLGTDGNYFRIAGTTQINLLDTTGWQGGSWLTMIFIGGAVVIKHNQAQSGSFKPFYLAGAVDYTANAGGVSRLTVVWDDAAGYWWETGRVAS